ncbi:PucR family transcriptional regulator, partial [Lentzea kentuckyensis]|uniref:PucR family transcriptional regulator n=1 Tax=Lentzea kentuckyensis TaxID=360086 RepID=UPI001179CC7D
NVLGPGPYRVVAGESRADYDVLAQRYGPLVSKVEDGFLALVPAGFEVSGPVGVSAEVPESGITGAVAEASALLARALATGAPAFPAAGLSSLVDPVAARAFARRELAGLLGRPELVETLRAWLGQHGSWDRAAATLGVHRNSVRHRISHVERLLGRDLDSADTRASLWLALTWLD